MAVLAKWLEDTQTTDGKVGAWSYGDRGLGRGDPSNTQFAVLALARNRRYRCAGESRRVGKGGNYWEGMQSPDGGWGYGGGGGSTGSMTVAGISSLAIVQHVCMTTASTLMARRRVADRKIRIRR